MKTDITTNVYRQAHSMEKRKLSRQRKIRTDQD